MNNLQILKSYNKRTEYKVLREWFSVEEQEVDSLKSGVCVIPAILLIKMSEHDRAFIIDWAKNWGNQLLIFPPMHDIDVVKLLDLNVDITVSEMSEKYYEGIPVQEFFKTNLSPKWQINDKDVIALDVKYHSGSGIITFTTLPLLNYRLREHKEKCKELLSTLIIIQKQQPNQTEMKDELKLIPLHHHLLLLVGASLINIECLPEQLKQYFFSSVQNDEALRAYEELIETKYITVNNHLTSLGEQFINNQGYHAFIRELKKRRQNDGDW